MAPSRTRTRPSSLAPALLLLGLVAPACGQKPACPGGTAVEISGNHGHALELTPEQIASQVDVVVALRGGEHQHSVGFPAARLAALREAGETTLVASSVNAHTHEVRVTCKR
ncbi:MAG: hypothetical protein FJ104_07220 [Deltaproteobacteria bacterium]|nr:hypothetical protein [Deltaproteobacteria bacterium]